MVTSKKRHARNGGSNRPVAVFFDNENVFYGSLHNAKSFPNYKAIMDKACEFGRIVHAVAICDWTRLAKGIPHISSAGISPVFSCHAMTAYDTNGNKQKYVGKQSSSDSQLHVNIYELMIGHPEIEVYVIVSGDRDFVPLVHSLRRFGKLVYVISEEVSLAWDLAKAATDAFTFQEIDALLPVPDQRPDDNPGDSEVEESKVD